MEKNIQHQYKNSLINSSLSNCSYLCYPKKSLSILIPVYPLLTHLFDFLSPSLLWRSQSLYLHMGQYLLTAMIACLPSGSAVLSDSATWIWFCAFHMRTGEWVDGGRISTDSVKILDGKAVSMIGINTTFWP